VVTRVKVRAKASTKGKQSLTFPTCPRLVARHFRSLCTRARPWKIGHSAEERIK
jgi:hypothetical protein